MEYPSGNPQRLELFARLLEKENAAAWDDEFLQLLIEYQRLCPESEHFDIFYAKYALAHRNYSVALEHALKAYDKRKVNYEIWKLLIACYQGLDRQEEALPFQAYCCKFYTQRLDTDLHASRLEKQLGILSNAMGIGNYAPFQIERMFLVDGKLKERKSVLAGEFIPETEDGAGYAYWSGIYPELEVMGAQGDLLELLKDEEPLFQHSGGRFVFDLMKSRLASAVSVHPQGDGCLLPIAGAKSNQKVTFQTGGQTKSCWVGKWEYSFFRLNEPTHIQAETPLVFGKPIPLGHSPRRKRLVLNILVDALSWNAMRCQNFSCMPNILKFFSQGIIFNQHFSVAEYTYPSLPTIETGMYPHHSQVFNEKKAHPLEPRYKTLSERMQELGYHCTNIAGGGDGIYNGVTRGYDRLLVNAYDSACYSAVERTIQHIEAFAECDQFIFLHLMDVHPWRVKNFHIPVATQTLLPLEKRLEGADSDVASVYLPNNRIYQDGYQRRLQALDRSLGALFDYIAQNLSSDEYIIQLYSDHGTSIFDDAPDVLSDNQTSTAYMLRGAGVPRRGMVEELTSALDIYPALAHLAGFPVGNWLDGNLPAVLGGRPREYVISNSIFPGQTYKLCIRTKEYTCSLESREAVDEDGTADLSLAKMTISTRTGHLIDTPSHAVRRYFLSIIKEHTQSFNHEGCYWPAMRKARPKWFANQKETPCGH